MNVAELIKHLGDIPGDTPVLVINYNDIGYDPLKGISVQRVCHVNPNGVEYGQYEIEGAGTEGHPAFPAVIFTPLVEEEEP